MRADAQGVLAAVARFYAPLIMLFGVMLLLDRTPTSGVGFFGGVTFSLVLLLQVIVRGASAARAAFPPWAARAMLACGVLLAVAGISAPRLTLSAQMTEAGAFLACVAAMSLVVVALAGRAPTMLGDAPE